jgi:group I intron endonuclease
MTGVYCIENNITGRKYYGSAVNVDRRFMSHKKDLLANRHINNFLQNSWHKHGENAFDFFVVEPCDKEQLLIKEQAWIDKSGYIGVGGYNINPIANSRLNSKWGEDSKLRRSIAMKGKVGVKHTDETKMKIGIASKGRIPWNKGKKVVYPAEAIIKIVAARKGRKHSDESIRKMSDAHKGCVAWNKGIKNIISEETRQKISKSLLGRPTWNKGKKNTLNNVSRFKLSESIRASWVIRKEIAKAKAMAMPNIPQKGA